MAADDLATQTGNAAAAMVLIQSFRIAIVFTKIVWNQLSDPN